MVADQPRECSPAPDKLAAVSQVVFPSTRGVPIFRWATASTGQDVLEIEMSGRIRWIPVLTSKP